MYHASLGAESVMAVHAKVGPEAFQFACLNDALRLGFADIGGDEDPLKAGSRRPATPQTIKAPTNTVAA